MNQPHPSTPAQVRAFAELTSRLGGAISTVVLGKPEVVRLALVCHVRPGAHPARGCARGGQDDAGAGDRRLGAGAVAAHPVHARPAALRRQRGHHLQPGHPRFRVPPRPDLRQHRHRRRDQPGVAEDPVGAAGGHGGAVRHRRRGAPPGAAPVPGGGHPEPGRDGRHLPAARSAAGPVPPGSWPTQSAGASRTCSARSR